MFSDINKDGQEDVLGLSWEGDEIIGWEQTSITTSTTLTTPNTARTISTTNLNTNLIGTTTTPLSTPSL